MAEKGDEWVKYMTERFVNFMEMPQEVRKQKRETAKAAKEPWLTRWFGIAPFGVALWWRTRGRRQR
ncbi:YqzE family protein [Paenibacillus sp. sptzw28]|uniref:YqzE family protein n=1 Tax=Paenibacillus sp. sptzw28 TaxID=715179 RepID=UPI001C6DFF81|nr:YqzE family protein [Paenibacillus sp. sptzw28]QYR23550.1 YqzE family protein [Paenibacillus sp. sptzw28]